MQRMSKNKYKWVRDTKTWDYLFLLLATLIPNAFKLEKNNHGKNSPSEKEMRKRIEGIYRTFDRIKSNKYEYANHLNMNELETEKSVS